MVRANDEGQSKEVVLKKLLTRFGWGFAGLPGSFGSLILSMSPSETFAER